MHDTGVDFGPVDVLANNMVGTVGSCVLHVRMAAGVAPGCLLLSISSVITLCTREVCGASM